MDKFLLEAEKIIGAVADQARREGVIDGLLRARSLVGCVIPRQAAVIAMQLVDEEIERLRVEVP